jgi:hypothetical protein
LSVAFTEFVELQAVDYKWQFIVKFEQFEALAQQDDHAINIELLVVWQMGLEAIRTK